MKNIKSLLFLLIIAFFGLSSCQKDIVFVEGSGPGGTTPPATAVMMSAKVNGVLVNCELATAQLVQSTGDLQINGFKGTEAFTLTFQGFKGVGTYNAADFTSFANYTNGITDPLVNGFFAESGVIKITSYTSTLIKGTFEFKAANSVGDIKTITEGTFVVSLAGTPAPIPGTGDKSLVAKVDGTSINFSSQSILTTTPLGKTLTIIGTNGVKALVLVIYDFKGVGTYTVDKTSQCSYNEDQSSTGSYMATTVGKIVITSSSGNTIKGTFDFVAPNEDFSLTTKKTITEGTFNVTYTIM